MELSTNIPIPNAKPPIEITFNDNPVKYINKNAPIIDVGIANATAIVGLILRKNKNNTATAAIAPSQGR